jgi:gas vesicle protein
MENKNKNHDSGNGFLLGVVVGSIATLLFTTKKGRQILKELTDRGIESISELEKKLKNAEEPLQVIEEENDYSEPEMRPIPDSMEVDEREKEKLEKIEEKLEKASSRMKATIPTPKPQRSVKRFFKKRA